MDSHLWLNISLFFLYLIFAVPETAAHLLSRHKAQPVLDSLRERSIQSRRLLPQSIDTLVSMLIVGRMLGLASVSVGVTSYFYQSADYTLPVTLAVAVFLGATALPSALTYRNPKTALAFSLLIARYFNIILLPVTLPRVLLLNRYRKLIRKGQNGVEDDEQDAQQIEAYLDEGKEEGLFEPDEAELVRQVMEFGGTVVKEVMTPRVDIACVDKTTTVNELLTYASEYRFSRFPVMEGKIDNIVGIVHIKSVMSVFDEDLDKLRVDSIMSLPLFVPESKKVNSLLRDFQNDKQHMAIVVDEYGGTAGLITLEDILEEIVGEIEDEHSQEEVVEGISLQDDGSMIVSGNVDVSEIEDHFDLELDDDNFETISGLALNHLKRIPKAGEEFEANGLSIKIIAANEKTITRLHLTKITKNE